MEKMTNHFQRFEFKYLISPQQKEDIRRKLEPYMAHDSFTSLQTPSYQVHSLYLDSPLLYFYHQKQDGVERRKKFRVRSYRMNGDFAPYVFFEIKRKQDAVILKDRFVLKDGQWKLFLETGKLPDGLVADDRQQKIIGEYEYERAARALSPNVLVVYDREPYVGKLNKNFRVTFDTNMRACETDAIDCADANALIPFSGYDTVLELKFTGTLPYYVANIIQMFNLERIAYSKYCHAVDATILRARGHGAWRPASRPTVASVPSVQHDAVVSLF